MKAFIDTFGITRPTEATLRNSAWFIAGMLLSAAAIVVVAFFVAFKFFG